MTPPETDLFGTPACDPEQSQWMTPPWLAERLAEWVPPSAWVFEPSAGSGNLVAALLRRGHPGDINMQERDPRWIESLRRRFPDLPVMPGDFLVEPWFDDAFDVVMMNPPFEDDAHAKFVARALELAPIVVGIFPSSIEFGEERDRTLWMTKAQVVRRARLPCRVKYGGDNQASFDTVALKIVRRDRPRAQDELSQVTEEVWRP